MTDQVLYRKIAGLPAEAKLVLSEYVEFLLVKYKSQNEKPHPKAGCMKGTFKIVDEEDFNQPLDDFNAYL